MIFLKEKKINAFWSCNLKFGKFHQMNRSSSFDKDIPDFQKYNFYFEVFSSPKNRFIIEGRFSFF